MQVDEMVALAEDFWERRMAREDRQRFLVAFGDCWKD